MLRLSKLTDYGTVVMTYLARESARLHAASEIATEIQIAAPTVSKILKRLAREGLVVSHRGAKGGYSLARPAREISVVEIIDALEGRVGLTECGTSEGLCSQESSCSIRTNWQSINLAVRHALAGVTLAEMAEPPRNFISLPVSRAGGRVNVVSNG
ncbi:MAG: SUF system Fe-S cluster assembly regulator [Gammaproteobacteria bacterium]|nr:SUF system Fe-S cluster assembly regulator [Gammaproteobacteria bacterium]